MYRALLAHIALSTYSTGHDLFSYYLNSVDTCCASERLPAVCSMRNRAFYFFLLIKCDLLVSKYHGATRERERELFSVVVTFILDFIEYERVCYRIYCLFWILCDVMRWTHREQEQKGKEVKNKNFIIWLVRKHAAINFQFAILFRQNTTQSISVTPCGDRAWYVRWHPRVTQNKIQLQFHCCAANVFCLIPTKDLVEKKKNVFVTTRYGRVSAVHQRFR